VCPRFSVLCCPVQIVALQRADPPSKESYQMSKNRFISYVSQILNRNRTEGLIRINFTLVTEQVEKILICIFRYSTF
jgi:hypothetical protein